MGMRKPRFGTTTQGKEHVEYQTQEYCFTRKIDGQVIDELPRIESALHCIDPEDRKTWLKVGMAVRGELGESGFQLWDDWSQGADNYNERDSRDVWRSFGESGPVGLGTLFHLAREAGWNDSAPRRELTPEQVEERRRSREEAKKKGEAEAARQQAQTAAWAKSIWQQAREVLAHRYLERKQVTPTKTLRQIDADQVQRILGYAPLASGQTLDGSLLVVPMRKADASDLCSVELIDESGRKTALLGQGTKTGAFWSTSRLDSPSTLLIGEGVATVLSASQAADAPGVAALSSTNLKAVALAMRDQFPSTKITLLADLLKDTGEPDPHAVEAAQAVGSHLTVPDFGPGRERWQKDFNDLAVIRGADAVRACVEAAGQVEDKNTGGLTALRRDDLMAIPDIDWIIKGVMPSQGIGVLFGPSTVGKSFMMLDLAAHLAEGREWFGYRAKRKAVVYACLEGQHGFKRRVEGWEAYHARQYPNDVIFSPDLIDIRTEQDTAALIELARREAGPGAVVIVDTLNRAAPGLEENGSVDYGLILASAGRIAQELQGFVFFVGHPGKDPSRGLRGHYSMFAGLDLALEAEEVNKTELSFAWTLRKVKDGQDGIKRHFRREVVDLGTDSDGDPVTSCIIVPNPEADQAAKSSPQKAMTRKEGAALTAFKQAAIEYGQVDAGGRFIGLHLEDWRKHFYAVSPAEKTSGKRSAFNKAKNALIGGGWLLEDVYGNLTLTGPGADVHAEIIATAITENQQANPSEPGTPAEAKKRTEPNPTPIGVGSGSPGPGGEFEEIERPNRTHQKNPFPGAEEEHAEDADDEIIEVEI